MFGHKKEKKSSVDLMMMVFPIIAVLFYFERVIFNYLWTYVQVQSYKCHAYLGQR